VLRNCLDIDYKVESPGPHHVPVGSEILLMKIDEEFQFNSLDKPAEGGWLILRVIDSKEQMYERFSVMKLRLSAREVPILNQLREKLAKQMILTII
jgi:hypothetical protein